MTLSSMTGFARADGHAVGLSWHWEVKSVNGKSLDIRFRLPQGLEALEIEARALAQSRFHRGNLQVSLDVRRASLSDIRINEAALNRLLKLAKAVQKKHKFRPPSIEGLLALPGVLEESEDQASEDTVAARNRLLLATLAQAFDHLVATRRHEGEKLRAVVLAQIECLASLAEEARDSPERSPERIKARLQLQLDRLLDLGRSFDADRLHQEALLLATRGDIQEELDRIFAHVSASRQLLKDGSGPVGRKLDFLAQEFHREANTLCAKSQVQALSAIGLALKGIIDQMREQVQNIE
jgi:uncharacterized protein (TIGR00255 family)